MIKFIKNRIPKIYISTFDYKSLSELRLRVIGKLSERNKNLLIVNNSFAEEIQGLESELKKYKRPRNKKGQIMSESAANFKRVHDELRAKYGKQMLDDVIPNYNDIKEASKMEGFGR